MGFRVGLGVHDNPKDLRDRQRPANGFTLRNKGVILYNHMNHPSLQALYQIENNTMTEYYEESGFNETDALSSTQLSNGFLNR